MSGNFIANLSGSFQSALENKENGRFNRSDIDQICKAMDEVVDHHIDIPQKELQKLATMFSDLTGGSLKKGGAMKKLQGTSRTQAIRSVLEKAI